MGFPFLGWGFNASWFRCFSKERKRYFAKEKKEIQRLVSLQGDLGLNICEAHAFNTSDRFSLDIFVVDGWKPDGCKESLEQALSSRFAQVAQASQPSRELQPSSVGAAANAADRRRWVCANLAAYLMQSVLHLII
jgi:UTP:GlnB (protein PII) uridylyltransferase